MNNVVHCKAVDLLESLPDRSVGALISDPPFHVSVGRAANWSEKRGLGSDPWTEVTHLDEVIDWTRPHIEQASRVLRLGGPLVVMGGTQSLLGWDLLAPKFGFQWMSEVVVLWNMGKVRARNFGSLHTRIMWYAKSGSRHQWNHPDKAVYSNVLMTKKVPVRDRRHPSEKPISITNFFISLLTKPDDLVLDPFCGSGSTLVSADLCNRDWLGCDMDRDSVNAARRRLTSTENEVPDPIYLWVNGQLQEV